MYLQKLGQLQQNGLLGNLGMGSASGAEQMMAHGQQLAQMGAANNQLERMKQISLQSAQQALQEAEKNKSNGLGSLLNLGIAAATGGWTGLAQAAGGELVSEATGSPILGKLASLGIGSGLKDGMKATNTAGDNVAGNMAKEQMNTTAFSDDAVTKAALKANDSKYLFAPERFAKPVGYNTSMNWRNQVGRSAPYFPM